MDEKSWGHGIVRITAAEYSERNNSMKSCHDYGIYIYPEKCYSTPPAKCYKLHIGVA